MNRRAWTPDARLLIRGLGLEGTRRWETTFSFPPVIRPYWRIENHRTPGNSAACEEGCHTQRQRPLQFILHRIRATAFPFQTHPVEDAIIRFVA